MIYDMAVIRLTIGFAVGRRIMELTKNVGIVVDDFEKIGPIWWNRQQVVGEFKVFFHYNKKYSENVKEWREKYDRKTRYHYRSRYCS